MVGLTACSQPIAEPNNSNNNPTITSTTTNLTGSQQLKQFDTVSELKNFLAAKSISESGSQNTMMDKASGAARVTTTDAISAPVAPEGMIGTAINGGESGATDYSHTNVQVQGVDEADFVKNDDKYIYMIADNKLVIIDALKGNAENSQIISETELNLNSDNYYGSPTLRELFLNKDKVVLFVDTYEKSFYLEKYNIEPIETSKQNTVAYIYDVSDRSKPKLIDTYTISGGYFDSRMINNVVYVISQENLYNWQYYDGPMVAYAKTVVRPNIYYFDNPEQNYQMNTVTSINLDDDKVVDSKSFMLGYSNTLMVSENNIYIAYQKQRYWCWGWRCGAQDTDNKERFMKVVVPLLEGDIKNSVTNILNQKLSEEEEWTQISAEFNKFYIELKSSDTLQNKYQDMFNNIETALAEYDAKKAIEDSKTIIHKISIKDGKIDYVNKGEVDGRLLNQFSLDEYNGNLRVATTVSIWLNKIGNVQYNNIYVLGDDMKVVGSLERLAENESIYSTRFIGDKLFMVTFRQIDPFFVIDLSNPKNPEVLGYLKIPGYSSYLHPVSDTLIIGVGKETGENEYGRTTTKGVKVSLFNISDFSNPKEVDKYEIGIAGTDSPVLYDHKAFLYSASKSIMVIPVTEITEKTPAGQYNYINKIWTGAYVFKVSDKGFELIGKVKHSSSETQYYYWFNDASVKRSLYLDNYLYTISNKYVKVNDLNNNLNEINSIPLPFSENAPQIYY